MKKGLNYAITKVNVTCNPNQGYINVLTILKNLENYKV